MDWAEGGVEIEIRCDAGQILTKQVVGPSQEFATSLETKSTERTKARTFIPGQRFRGQAVGALDQLHLVMREKTNHYFYGFDTARFPKEMLAELLFGNVGCSISTYVRNDNSDAVYRMESTNTVADEND